MTAVPDVPALVFDCTELFNNPVETGIQRVVRRMLRHWPAGGPALHAARFDRAHGLVRISGAALELLQETQDNRGGDAVRETQARLIELSPPQQPSLPDTAPILLPEVFWDLERTRFYRALLGSRTRVVAMLAYDFIAFLQPSFFRIRSGAAHMEYLRLLTEATAIAFISGKTRREYLSRITRDARAANAGPALRLGSDGLRAPRQTWQRSRNAFVCIGTIERRKNQHLIVQAFQELWATGSTARLVLVGHCFAPAIPEWLIAAMEHPSFTWLEAASDDQVAEALMTARATIYAAECEGFGLPPVESLHVGVPVIASAYLPSLEGLGAEGQIRLQDVTVESLKAAVSSMLVDRTAGAQWKQAATVSLPTWDTFADEVAAWCVRLPSPVPPADEGPRPT